MSTLSKEFITETKKEISRLEASAKSIQARVKLLQDLLRETSGTEPVTKPAGRSKKSSGISESELQELNGNSAENFSS